MSGFMNTRLKVLLVVLVVSLALGTAAHAQASSTSGSGAAGISQICPTGEGGGWSWQADQAPVTTTVTGQAAFNLPQNPVAGCLVQVPVTLTHGTTVHEVHGNMSVTAFNSFSGGCGNGSVVVQLRDATTLNVIAAMKLGVLGPNSTNVPITATLPTPLTVSAFQFQFFVDLCGPQTISLSLVMS